MQLHATAVLRAQQVLNQTGTPQFVYKAGSHWYVTSQDQETAQVKHKAQIRHWEQVKPLAPELVADKPHRSQEP